jgi:hypothetical protein
MRIAGRRKAEAKTTGHLPNHPKHKPMVVIRSMLCSKTAWRMQGARLEATGLTGLPIYFTVKGLH